jgi:hypothetical protein
MSSLATEKTMGNASHTEGRTAPGAIGRWLQWLSRPLAPAQRTAPPGANSEPVILSPLQPKSLAGKWPDSTNLQIGLVVFRKADDRTAQER